MNAVKPGYVYFLHAVNSGDSDGMERYKIGLTTRFVEDRLKELNSGQSPYWLVEKWSIQVSDCEAAETALHKHFASRRLYFNTSNGLTAKYHEIDSADRKSTEWFMFAESELSSVEESYSNIQDQYKWQMLPPNKREVQQQREETCQDDRQWQQATGQVFQTGNSSDGLGWVIAFAAVAVVMFPTIGKMGSFADVPSRQNENPSFELPSMPSIDKWGDILPSLASPFGQEQKVEVAQLANLRSYVKGQEVPVITGKTIAAGTVVKVKKQGEWNVITDGKMKGLAIHRSMIKSQG